MLLLLFGALRVAEPWRLQPRMMAEGVAQSRKKYTVYKNPGATTATLSSGPAPVIDNAETVARPLDLKPVEKPESADVVAVLPFVALAALTYWRKNATETADATKTVTQVKEEVAKKADAVVSKAEEIADQVSLEEKKAEKKVQKEVEEAVEKVEKKAEEVAEEVENKAEEVEKKVEEVVKKKIAPKKIVLTPQTSPPPVRAVKPVKPTLSATPMLVTSDKAAAVAAVISDVEGKKNAIVDIPPEPLVDDDEEERTPNKFPKGAVRLAIGIVAVVAAAALFPGRAFF